MLKIGLVLFLTTYLSLKVVRSNPVRNVSYIEGINFQYKNDKWICGDVKCPADTFGCKISIKTDEKDAKVVNQDISCIDKDKMVIVGAGDIIEMAKEQTIDINLVTYVGASSIYNYGYGRGGNEVARGVLGVDELNNLKKTAMLTKKAIDEAKAPIDVRLEYPA